MELVDLVSSIILGLISLLLLTYSFFTSKEKGPILSNSYLLASKKERENLDKSAAYHEVTVVFGLLGIVCLLFTIRTISSWLWIDYIIGVFIVIEIIYVITVSIKSEINNK